MKRVDVVQLTRDAIAQTMGADYMPLIDDTTHEPIPNGQLEALSSEKLVDIGRDVTGEDTINSFANNLIAVLGKHIIVARLYTSKLPSIYVDSFDWGGFIERTRIGLGDIIADPMYNKVAGTSYSDLEHTYFGQDVSSKIFDECKAFMCPVSIERNELTEAFTSWDKMDEFISGKLRMIQSTINLGLAVYEKMLVSCALAVSEANTGTAVHLITEAVDAGILEKVALGTNPETYRNPTWDEARYGAKSKDFGAFCLRRIKETRDYMLEPSKAFNDGTIPTWCEELPNLIMLNNFANDMEFNVKADTFNPEYLGIGKFDKIVSWQASKKITPGENSDPDTVENFTPDVVSSIDLAADATHKLGIGTSEYKKSGFVALLFDPMAIGLCLRRSKVTSSYTACADFWNTYNHTLVNYLLDTSYGMVAFIMD